VPEPESIRGCVFSPDSRVLALAGHRAVRLVRVADGTELVRLPYAEESTILLHCFSPDGGTLYAHGADTGEVVAWDVRRIRDGLGKIGLDWAEPPLAPAAPPAPAWKVEFVGFEILSDAQAMARQRSEMIAEAVRTNPNDVSVHQIDFYYAVTNGLWPRAAAAHDRAVKLRPNDAGLRLGFGGLYAERGRRSEALADYAAALQLRPHPDSMIWYEHALLLIAFGHTDDYRKLCAAMVARYGATTDAGLGNLAHTVALHPHGLDDPAVVVRLAEKRSALPGLQKPWSDHVLAVAYYRSGRYAAALAAIPPHPTALEPHDGFVRAMAHHKSGDAAAARAAWTKASAELERLRPPAIRSPAVYAPVGWHWRNWLLALVLHDEAQTVLREPAGKPRERAPAPRTIK